VALAHLARGRPGGLPAGSCWVDGWQSNDNIQGERFFWCNQTKGHRQHSRVHVHGWHCPRTRLRKEDTNETEKAKETSNELKESRKERQESSQEWKEEKRAEEENDQNVAWEGDGATNKGEEEGATNKGEAGTNKGKGLDAVRGAELLQHPKRSYKRWPSAVLVCRQVQQFVCWW
jgi:hypothetical protein